MADAAAPSSSTTDMRATRRNTIALDLRSPKYRQRKVADKRKRIARQQSAESGLA